MTEALPTARLQAFAEPRPRVAADERGPVTRETWLEPRFNRWSFEHMSELIGSSVVSKDRPRDAIAAPASMAAEIDAFATATNTDALIVEQGGRVRGEWFAAGFSTTSPHLIMSVSKSLCSLVVGIVADESGLDLERSVGSILPSLRASAFGDATVRHLLDMTVGIAYDEVYADPDSSVAMHDRAAGWLDRRPDDPRDLGEYLALLERRGEHGERFLYCSANTDVLAWVVEAVAGDRYPSLLSRLLWSQLGCEADASITVDASGFAYANGGVSARPADLVRVGRLMLDRGSAGGRQVVPSTWIDDVAAGGDPTKMADSGLAALYAAPSYRGQWWHTGNDHGSYFAVGIHGQYIWVDPVTDTVIVKASWWPNALDDAMRAQHLRMFERLSRTEW